MSGNISEAPTDLLPPLPHDADPFLAGLDQLKELHRLYNLALAEIEVLNRALDDMRAGRQIKVIIGGKPFWLTSAIPETESLRAGDLIAPTGAAALQSFAAPARRNGHTSEVADSFVL